jgi:hypothetical protein
VTFTVARTRRPGSAVGLDFDFGFADRQRMAERDQFGGFLRRHDAGDARRTEHVALLGVARKHEVERLALHDDRPSATATRSVADLSETSTMRASPDLPRWVSLSVMD